MSVEIVRASKTNAASSAVDAAIPTLDINQQQAAELLMEELLAAPSGAADTLLVRALGEESEIVRSTALQASHASACGMRPIPVEHCCASLRRD